MSKPGKHCFWSRLWIFSLLAWTTEADAQTLNIVHSFSSFASQAVQGANPAAALIVSNNTAYGTTEYGGSAGDGTVFSLNPDGSNFTTIYSFSALMAPPPPTNHDGANPAATLVVSGNTLYGTTENGGDYSSGVIFSANLDGTGVTTLYSFTGGNDGGNPVAGLTLSGNTLYGTTENGGGSSSGTIFAIQTDGTGFTNLYSFTFGNDGAVPLGGLVLSGDTLYGTAVEGGANGDGTLFSIKTNGVDFTLLHAFTGTDGANPMAALTLGGGKLYGTTEFGGEFYSGAIFSLNTDGSDYTNFYSFSSFADGSDPRAGLVLSNNVLYGTASEGGNAQAQAGTIFSINTDGSGFQILYSFTGGTDGLTPVATLFLTNNTLYGTTEYGGASSKGTVFAVAVSGSGFTNLYSFSGAADGANPMAGLAGDTLYGTTYNGGADGDGVIFSLHSDGTGFAVLHSFEPPLIISSSVNSDGAYPAASVLLAGDTLFGTTQNGGIWGNGTLFAVNTDGTGFTNLHNFALESDGVRPEANLILVGDTLYGTTAQGGTNACGTIFSINTNGSDYKIIYQFTGGSDGANPEAGLLLSGETLYGDTEYGGESFGTVFSINLDGTAFTNIYTFTGGDDGNGPLAALALSGDTLYGTAESGGSTGWGTVFSVQTNGSNFMLLHTFSGDADGGDPYSALVLLSNTLYGTTYAGGVSSNGTVFAIQTDGAGFTNLYGLNGGSDGANPPAGVVLSGQSILIGPAEYGGAAQSGAIFSINTDGSGFTNLHSFPSPYSTGPQVNSDGAYPLAGLLLAEGTLYGTAYAGGDGGFGTVFSVLTNGSNFSTLYSFTNGHDGAYPQAGLIRLSNTLFSTATSGGKFGKGTVFAVNTNGTGFMPLHAFGVGSDGAYPAGTLLLWSNVLYGTTSGGGTSNSGTIFSVNPDGSGYSVLYNFTGGSDGSAPLAGLVVWSNSWLICTASTGGTAGHGTLFAIEVVSPAQDIPLAGPVTFSYSLPGGAQGSNPTGTPILLSEEDLSSNGLTADVLKDDDGSSSGQDGGSCTWRSGCSSSCGGTTASRATLDDILGYTAAGNGTSGNYGGIGFMRVNGTTGLQPERFVALNGNNGAGTDGRLFKFNGYLLATAESGGAFGDGDLLAYFPKTMGILDLVDLNGAFTGGVLSGDVCGKGNTVYFVASEYGPGGHGAIDSLDLCSPSQDLPPLTLTPSYFNSQTGRLRGGFSASFPTLSTGDLDFRPKVTLYSVTSTGTSPTYTEIGGFDVFNSGTATQTGSYTLPASSMPLQISATYETPCGVSSYSAPVTVYPIPAISVGAITENGLTLWYPATPGGFVLKKSPVLGRGAQWTDVTEPPPVQVGNMYQQTISVGGGNWYFKLGTSYSF